MSDKFAVEIISPENPILNLQEFFIEFINSEKIILLNINMKQNVFYYDI